MRKNADNPGRPLIFAEIKTIISISLWLIAWALAAAGPTAAQGGIAVVAVPPPQYTFGEVLTFQVSARSAAPITSALVFYRPLGKERATAGKAEFSVSQEVTAMHTLDLKARVLAPFTTVEYWWEIHDQAGASLTTQPQTFYYEDNRFNWQTRTRDRVTVHWYRGDAEFGQAAVDIASAAVTQANKDIGAPLPDQVNVYIYADEQDLRAALGLAGRVVGVSGHADPGLGVVMAAVAPGLEATTTMDNLIPHEITHLLIYKAVGSSAAYAQVPTWLNEGLAVLNQRQPNPDFPAVIAAANANGQLFSLGSLCGPFPSDPARRELAYAQSESVVRLIREQLGAKVFAPLLAAYADGASCEAGVERGLGISLAELEGRWLAGVVQANPVALKLRPLAAWLFLSLIVLVSLGLFLALALRGQARDRGKTSASPPGPFA